MGSGSVLSTMLDRLLQVFQPLVDRFSTTGTVALPQRTTLLVALIVVGVIVVLFAVAIALIPSKRKVVRKRRVRRTVRTVPVAHVAGAAGGGGSEAADRAAAARLRRRRREPVIWTAVLVIAVVLTFVGTYMYTGSNQYCGQSCHVTDPHVRLAVRSPHADCISCHEGDPVSGMVSRFRMAFSKLSVERTAPSAPVDPARCLGCHRAAVATTAKTATGLRISHKEILARGYTCSDCHKDVGHGKASTLTAGMAQCMSCHDGVRAPKVCTTCHTGGSPIAVASAATKARSKLDYGTVRAANRECARCHGAERDCIACHGLVLPHPAAFLQGGHARLAAFDGKKQRCFKCHSIQWCGNGTCHGNFDHPPSWKKGHQTYTSAQCGGCHTSFMRKMDPKADFCKVCH